MSQWHGGRWRRDGSDWRYVDGRTLSVGRMASRLRSQANEARMQLHKAMTDDPDGDHSAALAAVAETQRQRWRWEAGRTGEVRVAGALEELRRGVVLHDRLYAPESKANIDHLVIGPYGVFVVDAKNWAGHLTVTGNGLWKRPRDGGPAHSLKASLCTVRGLAERVTEAIGHPVKPVICLAGSADGISDRQLVQGVCLVPLEQLAWWIEGHEDRLTEQQWRTLHHRATEAFPRAAQGRAGETYWASPRMVAEQTASGDLRFVPEDAGQHSKVRSAASARPRTWRDSRAFGLLFGAFCWTTITLCLSPTRHLVEWLWRLVIG